MASVEQMQSTLDKLSSGGSISPSFIPNEDIIIQNMMKDVVGKNLSSEEVNKIKNSFTGALIKKEIQNLKGNLASFTKGVPGLIQSMITDLGTCCVPTAAPAIPNILTGIKSQLETLNTQATQILSSCVFLKVEVPDGFMTILNGMAGLKQGIESFQIPTFPDEEE